MSYERENDNEHFRLFAGVLERHIETYGVTEDWYDRQKAQVESLIELEALFRTTLIAHPWGPKVFQAFITFICDDKRNILSARPFFRERQDVFTATIAPALKARSYKRLYPHTFNYQFVLFVMRARRWTDNRLGTRIVKLAAAIRAVRTEIIEMNMPLAISRARIFWSCTPKSVLTFMDFVQISCDGLMSAVDKFVPPFGRVFRAVIIGRIVGNFIEKYSETMLHFYPADRRKLYRANKASRMLTEAVGFEELAAKVNEGASFGRLTSASEIADLIAASSCVSLDPVANGDDDPDKQAIGQWAVAPEELRPDVQAERRDAFACIAAAIKLLTCYEQKLLRLRGVDMQEVSL